MLSKKVGFLVLSLTAILLSVPLETRASEDEYLVGNWDRDRGDNLAVRRGHCVLMDRNCPVGSYDITSDTDPNRSFPSKLDLIVSIQDEACRGAIGWQVPSGAFVEEKLNEFIYNGEFYGEGNWHAFNSGSPDNIYTLAVDPENPDTHLVILWESPPGDLQFARATRTSSDGAHDIVQCYGNGNSEDEYLVGDWDGDGRDNLAVRRGHCVFMDTNFDGAHDIVQCYGNGTGLRR
jgi:hypothetical protein